MSAGGGPGTGHVVVLSGPSAVGKSTVVRCLRERIPNLHFSVSATTRAPRPGRWTAWTTTSSPRRASSR